MKAASQSLTALLIFAAGPTAQTAAPTLTTLHTFVNPPRDGVGPFGLVAGSGGVLYGVTGSGGLGFGTVFSLTPPNASGGTWTEAILYDFKGGADGNSPSGIALGSGGVLYGTTTYGGSGATCGYGNGCGTVFSLTAPASAGSAWTETVLYNFTGGSDGGNPGTGVVIGGGGALYGTTTVGGLQCIPEGPGCGVVFSLLPPKTPGGAWEEAVLYNFTTNAPSPVSPNGLTIGNGGVLYGSTQAGGTGTNNCYQLGCGTIFSLTPPQASGGAWVATVLYQFTGGSDGAQPSRVSLGSGGILYGTTGAGFGMGTVFSLTPPASSQSGPWTLSVLYSFQGGPTDTSNPASGVVIGSGGVLYGTGSSGPGLGTGALFSLTPPAAPGGAWTEQVLYNFAANVGGTSPASLSLGPNGQIYGTSGSGGPEQSGVAFALNPPAAANQPWIETTLHAFSGGGPGYGVLSALVAGKGGVLYGTTEGGGGGSCASGCGTVFSLTPPAAGGVWTTSTLYRFTGGSDGAYPTGGLAIRSDGALFGTAEFGGSGDCPSSPMNPPGCGVVFVLAPPSLPGSIWSESTLHSFSNAGGTCQPLSYSGCTGYTDGFYPATGVVIGQGSELYGTTSSGGTTDGGVLFSVTPPDVFFLQTTAWTESVLYNFSAFDYAPTSAGANGLAIGAGGALYGATAFGGAGESGPWCPDGCGTVFSFTPPATETTLYEFPSNFGGVAYPNSKVVIGDGGVLYGVIKIGVNDQGAVYSLTPPSTAGGSWTETVLYQFTGGSDGGNPNGLAIGTGPGGIPVLYGTTSTGGSTQCNCGTVFALIPPPSPDGVWALATLYTFTGGGDGAYPQNGVLVGDGVLFGVTQPNSNTGTVFALTVGNGLAPYTNPGGVVNAASYTAPVAPGSIASVFGSFLLSSPLGAMQSPLPDELSGLSLQFTGGIASPLFYASSGQVNFQVPWEVSAPSQSALTASLDGSSAAAQNVNVVPVAPAIFSTDSSGSGQGAITDPSYRLVDSSNPATAGSTVVLIYCTGLGPVSNQPATGAPAPSTEPLARSATPTVTIGGVNADVQFAGLAPGFVGLYQVNALVPAGIATSSAVPVSMSLGGVTSNTVTIAVQ